MGHGFVVCWEIDRPHKNETHEKLGFLFINSCWKFDRPHRQKNRGSGLLLFVAVVARDVIVRHEKKKKNSVGIE